MSTGNFRVPDAQTICEYCDQIDMVSGNISSQLQQFTTDFNSFDYSVHEFISAINAKLTEWNNTINQLQQEMNSIKSKMQKYQEAIRKLEILLNQIQSKCDKKEEELLSTLREIDDLEKSDDADKDQKIAQCKQKAAKLKEEINQLKAEFNQNKQLHDKLVTDYNEFNYSYTELEKKQQKYIDKLYQLQMERDNFQAKWQIVHENYESENFQNTVSSVTEELSSLSDNLRKFADAVSEIERFNLHE